MSKSVSYLYDKLDKEDQKLCVGLHELIAIIADEHRPTDETIAKTVEVCEQLTYMEWAIARPLINKAADKLVDSEQYQYNIKNAIGVDYLIAVEVNGIFEAIGRMSKYKENENE